jgi:hypothetical protein
MDPATLAGGLAGFLAPLMPFLTGAGRATAEAAAAEAGHTLGEGAFRRIVRLWQRRLWPALRERPTAMAAMRAIVADPRSRSQQAALARELELLLRDRPDLAREVAGLLRQFQVTVTASERSIAPGSMTNSIAITGDGNTVTTGKYNIGAINADNVHLGDDHTDTDKNDNRM